MLISGSYVAINESKMQKILFLVLLFASPSAMASGDPLVVYMLFGVVLAWIAVISLQFLIKSSKKAKIFSALNIIVGLAFFTFLLDMPHSYKTHWVNILIVTCPIFCGITNILILKFLR